MKLTVVMSTFQLNSTLFGVGSAGAASIITGLVLLDDVFDMKVVGRTDTTFHLSTAKAQNIGIFLFVCGWILSTVVASMYFEEQVVAEEHDDDQTSTQMIPAFSYSWGFAIIAMAVLVFLSANGLQKLLQLRHGATGPAMIANYPKHWMLILALVFALSWYALVTFIAFKDTMWDPTKFAFGISGATMILLGMHQATTNRLAGVTDIKTFHIYNVGLPYFAVGWMLVLMAASIQRPFEVKEKQPNT